MIKSDAKGNAIVKTYALSAIVATVVAVIARVCCLVWFYDEEIGYYTKGFVPMALNVFCFFAVAFMASGFLVTKKAKWLCDGREDNLAVKITSVLCALAFVAFFVISVVSTTFVSQSVVSDLLIKISSLMAIAYFAINLFGSNAKRSVQVLLGFGLIVWAICILAITYFDVYVQLNSPDKIMLHLALISAMAFLVSEFRAYVIAINHRLYLFCASFAVFFLATCTIPSLVKWIIDGMSEYKYLYYDVVLLILLGYVTVRLLTFAFCIDKREVENQISAEEVKTENEI